MKITNNTPLKKTAERVLDFAKKQGATSAEVSGGIEEGYAVSVRMGQTDVLEYHKTKQVSITAYINHKKSTATTSDLSDDSLKKSVAAAIAMAKAAESDPCAGLAEKELMAKNVPDLDLCHPWALSAKNAIKMALDCDKSAREYDSRIRISDDITLETYQSNSFYANSHGFIGLVTKTLHSLSCALVASENSSAMQRDYDYTTARNAKDLISPKALAQKTAKRVIARLHPKKIKTCKVPVVLEARIAKSLWGNLIGAMSGSRLYKKASFLCDQLEKKVSAEHINIFEKPYIKGGYGSCSFDGDGVATSEKHFIENGILKNYILNSYTARKLGMQTTGNAGGIFNVSAIGKTLKFNDLLKEMHQGLLITELIGQGVNLITGDYSRGAFGYWIENGIIQYPVSEITIAGNLKEMFSNLVALGDDIDTRGNLQTGSVLLEEMTIAGIQA